LTTNRTGDVASVFIINIVSAGAGGVETMDHVAGVNVRESLRGQDLNIDSVRASQMILEITFSTLSNMNVGNLLSLTFWLIIVVSVVQLPLAFASLTCG